MHFSFLPHRPTVPRVTDECSQITEHEALARWPWEWGGVFISCLVLRAVIQEKVMGRNQGGFSFAQINANYFVRRSLQGYM